MTEVCKPTETTTPDWLMYKKRGTIKGVCSQLGSFNYLDTGQAVAAPTYRYPEEVKRLIAKML